MLIGMVLTAPVLTGANSTGVGTLFFACFAQKLAPAGKKIVQIYLPDLPFFASLTDGYPPLLSLFLFQIIVKP